MKKIMFGVIALALTSSLNASYASYMEAVSAQAYCDTKWTMTFSKENKNGRVCKKIGKQKWMKSCASAYSENGSPTSDQITKVAKKQWKLK